MRVLRTKQVVERAHGTVVSQIDLPSMTFVLLDLPRRLSRPDFACVDP